jgi:hypothetical protein
MNTVKHVGRDGAIALALAAVMVIAVLVAQLAATAVVYLGEILMNW